MASHIVPNGLDYAHQPLFKACLTLLSKHYHPTKHNVAACFLLSNGVVVQGLHLEGSCGRSSICAEGMALGAALIVPGFEGVSPSVISVTNAEESTHLRIEAVLALLYIPTSNQIRIIAPCGVCRELLFDYCPNATIYTWLPLRVSTPSTQVDQQHHTSTTQSRGFDASSVLLADGCAKAWKVRDLMPDKTTRAGW